MSIEAVGGESEGIVEIERTPRDVCADAVTTIGKYCIAPFWYFEGCLAHNFLPIHEGEYGQASSAFREKARRVFFSVFQIPALLVSMPYAGVGVACVQMGKLLHSRSYRVANGTFHGEVTGKLLFLNTQMTPGGIPYSAGLSSANERYDRLVRTIRDNNPALVFLAEVNPSCADALTNDLKDRYHFFFFNNNLLPPYLFVAFRGSLVRPPEYFSQGCFILETPDTLYLFVHHPSLKLIDQLTARDLDSKKVVLVGDLGSKRGSPVFEKLIEQGFIPGIQEGIKTETDAPSVHLYNLQKEATEKEAPFIFFKGKESSTEVEVVPVHLPEKIDEALSNKKLILA